VTIQDMSTLARRLPSGRPVWRAALIVLLLLVTGAAVGWAVNVQVVAAEGRSAEIVNQSTASSDRVLRIMSERLAAVKKDVAALEKDNDRMGARLERVTDSLWASLKNVRGLVAEARTGSNSALAEVGSALERAESAARNLSVLEDRFEYHLRTDHGGG